MKYPLGIYEKALIRSKTGKTVDDITLSNVLAGEATAQDIQISKETLSKQAQIANEANRPQLAENFLRAGELVDIPDEVILEMYNKLRPNRSTKQELLSLAETLKNIYGAEKCAMLVLEAAYIYEKRGILL